MSGPAPRALVIEHEDDAPIAWFGRWLTDAGARLDVCRPYRGDPMPADLAEHDALVVLGGEMSATSDELSWIPLTRALVSHAAEAGVPALGICLGHQLCAVALGGTVTRSPHGQQLGVQPVEWCLDVGEDPLLGPVAGAALAVHWNNDIIDDMPPGAQVLARGPAGEVQVARFADSVWGVQLHPEVDEAIVADWARLDDGARTAHGDAAIDVALARIAATREDVHAAWRPLAASLVRLAQARGIEVG